MILVSTVHESWVKKKSYINCIILANWGFKKIQFNIYILHSIKQYVGSID